MNTSIALGAIAPIDPTLPSELRQRRQQQQLSEQGIAMNQARLGAIGAEQEERQAKIARAQQVQDAIGRAGGDIEKALPEIWKIDTGVGDALSKHLEEKKRTQQQAAEKEIEIQGKRREIMGNALATVLRTPAERREAVYKAQRAALLNSGMFKPEHIPEELQDEDTLRSFATAHIGAEKLQGMDLKDAGEKRAQAGEKRAEAEATRKQQLHDAELPGKTADPETGLTSYQGATLGRLGKVDAETGRHNRAVESNQAARVSRAANQEAKAESATRKEFARQVTDGQRQIDSLKTEKERVVGEITKWDEVLKNNPEGMFGANSKRKDAVGKLAAAKARHEEIVRQQKEIKARMDEAQSKKDAVGGGGGGKVEKWELRGGQLVRAQ